MTDTYELTEQELESIRGLAYEKFIARGCEDGHDLEDWLAAEQEVRNSQLEQKGPNGVQESGAKKGRRASQPVTETAAAR